MLEKGFPQVFPSTEQSVVSHDDQDQLSGQEQQVLHLLHEVPQTFEALLAQLNWESPKLQATLSQLILKSLAVQTWHGYHRGAGVV